MLPVNSFGAQKISVTYRVPIEGSTLSWAYSETNLVNSSQDLKAKSLLIAASKSKAVKSKLLSECKNTSGFNARVKITSANGSTSGLGNLSSITVSSIRVTQQLANLPDYTEDESAALEEEYGSYEEYPDYIEDGYSYYQIEADCLFSGNISITTSNAYTFFIDGSRGPEYSRAELAKMNWKIVLVDV